MAAVLNAVLMLLLDVVEGLPRAGEVRVVLVEGVEGEEVLNVVVSVVVGAAGVGAERGVGRVQLCARASPTKPGAQSWHWGPVVLLMQRRQCPVSG